MRGCRCFQGQNPQEFLHPAFVAKVMFLQTICDAAWHVIGFKVSTHGVLVNAEIKITCITVK